MLRMLEEAGVAAEAGDLAGTRAALGAFRELVIHHFAEEERLMEESRYPDRGRHRAAHELFLQDFAQVSSGLDQGRLDDAARQLGHRVGEWLKFHVRVNDAPMAEHLAARKGGGRSKGTPSTKQPS